MNAIIVLWHQYVPRGITSYYRLYMEFFKRWANVWKDEFDVIYLVDGGWDITQKDLDDIGKCILLNPGDAHQWIHFANVIPGIPAENILLLDNDMVVYKKGLIKDCFDKLNNGKKIVSIFDGSGGMNEAIWKKIPTLAKIKCLRMSAYFTAIKKELMEYQNFEPIRFEPGVYLQEIDYTTKEGDWYEAFGGATARILSQLKEEEIEVIPNDANSFYLDDSGIYGDQKVEPSGCYHIRNWSLPVHLINDKKLDLENYKRQIPALPKREVCRLFAWLWTINEICGSKTNGLESEVSEILEDFKVSPEKWDEYIIKFREYHSWIKILQS